MIQSLGTARQLAPGLLLCVLVAAAAISLGAVSGIPVMVLALVIGMGCHRLTANPRFTSGIDFTAKRVLRFGVALLGARVTADEILSLGITPLIMVPVLVAATIVVGVFMARLLGRSLLLGVLTGGAVAVCGASAALAIAAVLPADADERDTLFTVIAVTALSTVAMVLYPIAFSLFGFSDATIGLLLGATIHDVAQVVGAGYAVSQEAGDVATFVKMLRVATLPVVVLVIAFAFRNRDNSAGKTRLPVPGFAVAFAIILVVNSLGVIPRLVVDLMEKSSSWMLVAAIAALGIKTSLKAMGALGPRHMALVVGETVFLMFAALAVVLFLV